MDKVTTQRLVEAQAFVREFAMTEDVRGPKYPRPDTIRTLPSNVIDLAQYRRQRSGGLSPQRSA
jgi:hypothetical protein